MAEIGFTYYDAPVAPVGPTVQELITSLSVDQRNAILDGFVKGIIPAKFRDQYRDLNVPKVVVRRLYEVIDAVEERARSLMRGGVLITPEVVDPETGEVTTPAEYNTPPSTSTELITAITSDFSDDLNEAQATVILTLMVEHSKRDGSGTWIYYKAEVVK